MLNKLHLTLCLVMLPIAANSQPLFAVWDVNFIDELEVANIKLDIRDDGQYFLVNGTVNTELNQGRAAVGSCYAVVIGDIICELDVRNFTYSMTIRENLNGTLEIHQDGVLIDEGTLVYRP